MAGIYVNHSPPGARSIKVGVLTGISSSYFFLTRYSDFSLCLLLIKISFDNFLEKYWTHSSMIRFIIIYFYFQ